MPRSLLPLFLHPNPPRPCPRLPQGDVYVAPQQPPASRRAPPAPHRAAQQQLATLQQQRLQLQQQGQGPHGAGPTAALEAADEALARELDEPLGRNLCRSASPSRASAALDPARERAAAAAGSSKQAPAIGGGGIGGGVQPPGYAGAHGSAADYADVGAAMSGADAAAVAAVLAEDEQHGEEAAWDVMDLDPAAAMRYDPHGEGVVPRGARSLCVIYR